MLRISLQVLHIFVFCGEELPFSRQFELKYGNFFARNINKYKIWKLHKAVFSIFYNTSRTIPYRTIKYYTHKIKKLNYLTDKLQEWNFEVVMFLRLQELAKFFILEVFKVPLRPKNRRSDFKRNGRTFSNEPKWGFQFLSILFHFPDI